MPPRSRSASSLWMIAKQCMTRTRTSIKIRIKISISIRTRICIIICRRTSAWYFALKIWSKAGFLPGSIWVWLVSQTAGHVPTSAWPVRDMLCRQLEQNQDLNLNRVHIENNSCYGGIFEMPTNAWPLVHDQSSAWHFVQTIVTSAEIQICA